MSPEGIARPLRLGLFLDMRNPPHWARAGEQLYRGALDLAEEAESLGLDAVWMTEHHQFPDGYLPQPLILAAAIAARTSRIRIGTAVVLAALRHPMHIAEEAAVVDLLSNGRLELGFGAGYVAGDYEAFGVDIARRFALTDERVRQVRECWNMATPAPSQNPVPLWLGYQGTGGAGRAGRLGVGLLSLNGARLAPYLDGLDAGGHDRSSARMGGVISMLLADDPNQVWSRVKEHVAYQVGTYLAAAAGTLTAGPALVDTDALRVGIDGGWPAFDVVTPAHAVERIAASVEGLPVTDVYLWASIAGMPDDVSRRHIELLANVVAPAVRDRTMRALQGSSAQPSTLMGG